MIGTPLLHRDRLQQRDRVAARFRRRSRMPSMDLGANWPCDVPHVLFPDCARASSPLAARVALSWDEVIVTILHGRGNTRSRSGSGRGLRTVGNGAEINVVAADRRRAQLVPVSFAHRLTSIVDIRLRRPAIRSRRRCCRRPDRRTRHAAVLMSARPASCALAHSRPPGSRRPRPAARSVSTADHRFACPAGPATALRAPRARCGCSFPGYAETRG